MRFRSLSVLIGLLLFLVLGAGVLMLPGVRATDKPAILPAPSSPTQVASVLSVVQASPKAAPSPRIPLQEDGEIIPSATALSPTGKPTLVVVSSTQLPVASENAPQATPLPPSPVPPTDLPAPPTATDVPLPPSQPERVGGPVAVPNKHAGPRWVTLQAGHWRNDLLPDEQKHLSGHTGASAGGVDEVDVNVAVARLTAKRLQERGYSVEILDATVPVSYTTDLFIALHADGNARPSWRGFKAVAPWVSVPASDAFVGFLYEEYGKATGLPSDAFTSDAMADYYAFSPVRYRHALAPGVPSALLEMGFVTNPDDRKVLSTRQDSLAWGIANAVDRYFRSGQAGTPPTPYPTFTPTVTPTRTPTNTSTPTSTSTPTPTGTATPIPTEFVPQATETAAFTTPQRPSTTPTLPKPTFTPIPTSTPLTGTITLDGRWLPPLSQNGRNLPRPGTDAQPVLLDDSTQYIPLAADGREIEQVWQQFYVSELGRSIWKKGPVRFVRH